MTAVYLIERSDNVRKTDRSKNEWESGFWDITEESARKLVGAKLYLHRSKNKPSHFGGTILSYRIEPASPSGTGVVFTVRADAAYKDVKTEPKGWAKDHKILWDASEPAHA
jgi:hypothetical protein